MKTEADVHGHEETVTVLPKAELLPALTWDILKKEKPD